MPAQELLVREMAGLPVPPLPQSGVVDTRTVCQSCLRGLDLFLVFTFRPGPERWESVLLSPAQAQVSTL